MGDYLGDMMNEISSYGKGAYVSEFVSGVTKNYALRIVDKDGSVLKTTCKLRGITIISSNEDTVSFDYLKAMIV